MIRRQEVGNVTDLKFSTLTLCKGNSKFFWLFLQLMNLQKRIVIALGSNQGDRLTQLTDAIEYIHQNVATVLRVSPIYETPALGFEGAPFYNAVLLAHSCSEPERIMQQLLEAELEMGRVRIPGQGYADRAVDLDLIAVDELLLETDNLTLPHPRMQSRRFVLEPMAQIYPDWRHPVLEQSTVELLAVCPDDSVVKRVKQVQVPALPLDFSHLNYIAIEGNIGAGKTTLTTKIAEDFKAKTVLERFADNPFLPKFYKDQHRYAFPLEMSFLADRYQQISDDLSQFDLFSDFIIADYHIFKSLIFAQITLAEDEYRLYRKLFDIIYREMPQPDLYVYLYQNTERLLENIKKRGRSYEQEIPADYLEKINRGYLDFIKGLQNVDVLVIDVSDIDFVAHQEDYLFILNQISERLKQKTT